MIRANAISREGDGGSTCQAPHFLNITNHRIINFQILLILVIISTKLKKIFLQILFWICFIISGLCASAAWDILSWNRDYRGRPGWGARARARVRSQGRGRGRGSSIWEPWREQSLMRETQTQTLVSWVFSAWNNFPVFVTLSFATS